MGIADFRLEIVRSFDLDNHQFSITNYQDLRTDSICRVRTAHLTANNSQFSIPNYQLSIINFNVSVARKIARVHPKHLLPLLDDRKIVRYRKNRDWHLGKVSACMLCQVPEIAIQFGECDRAR